MFYYIINTGYTERIQRRYANNTTDEIQQDIRAKLFEVVEWADKDDEKKMWTGFRLWFTTDKENGIYIYDGTPMKHASMFNEYNCEWGSIVFKSNEHVPLTSVLIELLKKMEYCCIYGGIDNVDTRSDRIQGLPHTDENKIYKFSLDTESG